MDPERNGGHDVTRRASGRHGLAGTAVRLRPHLLVAGGRHIVAGVA
jgi:hypothetical protein